VPVGRISLKTVRKVVLGSIAAVALTGVLGTVGFLYWVTHGLPSYDTLAHYEPPITTRVYGGSGTLIGEYARERRFFVPIDAIPEQVKQAFISAEDKNFYSHPGIDVFGIARAVITDLRDWGRRPQGASTITQQVARNFLLSNERTVTRKLREMVLAMRIDSTFPKDKILELYLNEIFLGENSYGVAAAATVYFGKSLDELTLGQTAFIAGLPKAPANYNPRRHLDAALERRSYVLSEMQDNGFITAEEAAQARAEELVTSTRAFGAVVADVDYFVEEVRRILFNQYGEQALYDGGLQVRSTLETRLQEMAVRNLRRGLIAYDHRHGWRGSLKKLDMKGDWATELKAVPNRSGVASWRVAAVTGVSANAADITMREGDKGRIPLAGLAWARPSIDNRLGPEVRRPADVVKVGDVVYVEALADEGNEKGLFGLRQVPAVNGAIVAIDPFTGHVLALSGGFSYGSSQFDRAMQAMRQPGSTFKPFVYAAALDKGYTPVTKVLDAPFAVEQGPFLPLWAPENYEAGEYLGLTTLRRGMELSRNVMTARLAHTIGMDAVAETAERMGVYEKLPRFLANSLGAEVTSLLKLTAGYAEFVNGGRKLEPTLIDRVQDRFGKTVYRFDKRDCKECSQAEWKDQEEPLLEENKPQVVDPRTAYQMVSILEGVVQRGTGVTIRSVGKPLAGKTGTSSDYRDAWFVGFSPDLAVGIFIGFDDFRSLGQGEAGALAAAPIFREFMREALADKPATPFRIPQGIIMAAVDSRTGTPVPEGTPGSILEAFKPGTEPGSGFVQSELDDTGTLRPFTVQTGVGSGPATSNPGTPITTTIGSGTGGLY
jgi:penicillin-binding protein 1A